VREARTYGTTGPYQIQKRPSAMVRRSAYQPWHRIRSVSSKRYVRRMAAHTSRGDVTDASGAHSETRIRCTKQWIWAYVCLPQRARRRPDRTQTSRSHYIVQLLLASWREPLRKPGTAAGQALIRMAVQSNLHPSLFPRFHTAPKPGNWTCHKVLCYSKQPPR
jgi:hypothetical protein